MAFIDTNRTSALNAALSAEHETREAGIFALFQTIKSSIEAAKRRKQLRRMSPHLLRDIGLTSGDISVLQAEQNYFDALELESLRHIR